MKLTVTIGEQGIGTCIDDIFMFPLYSTSPIMSEGSTEVLDKACLTLI